MKPIVQPHCARTLGCISVFPSAIYTGNAKKQPKKTASDMVLFLFLITVYDKCSFSYHQ